tara:strand:+ start:369 stop:773 length:405 start_codon:yes stop_codon:yes gene_type:complete
MAYLGSTQLTSVANPPINLFGGIGAGADQRIAGGSTLYINNDWKASTAGTYKHGQGFGQQLWMYNTTDMTSAILAAGYFTDAGNLGVRPGDVFIMVSQGTSLGTSQMLRLAVVSGVSTAGAASFSTASTIMSAS